MLKDTVQVNRDVLVQALDTLEALMQDSPRPYDALQGQAAIDALKAALAEPVSGCDHCTHPQYAGIRCNVCGRWTEK